MEFIHFSCVHFHPSNSLYVPNERTLKQFKIYTGRSVALFDYLQPRYSTRTHIIPALPVSFYIDRWMGTTDVCAPLFMFISINLYLHTGIMSPFYGYYATTSFLAGYLRLNDRCLSLPIYYYISFVSLYLLIDDRSHDWLIVISTFRSINHVNERSFR